MSKANFEIPVDALRSQIEETERRCGRESLYYFNKKILGYSLMERRPHEAVARFIQNVVTTDKEGLILEPRGSFKTTQITQGLATWLLTCVDPNMRILLDSAVLQNSIDNLRVIKQHLANNQKLRYLYGDLVGDYWVNEEFTVRTRTRHDLKEPSVRCASVERVQVGPHYDVIICDDLVDKLNSKSHDGRQSLIEHLKLLYSLLEPGGIIIVAGTRWHYDDLYGYILSNMPKFARRVKSAITPAGDLYFPERLTKKFLDSQLATQGRDIYSAQYLNDPAPEDADSPFQRTWFKPIVTIPRNHNTFVSIDPGGEKKGSDEWVVFAAHVDESNNKYFDRLRKGNWKMKECWNVLFNEFVDPLNPLCVGLETTGGQKWLYEALMDEMKRRNKFFMVQALAHAGDSKDYRIKRLQPQYQAGAVFHSTEMGPLEDQLLRYPKGADDIPDAASMILEICYPPRAMRERDEKPKTADEYFLRQHRNQLSRKHRHSLLGDNA